MINVTRVLASPEPYPRWAREIARWIADVVAAPAPQLGRPGELCPYVPAAIQAGAITMSSSDVGSDDLEAIAAAVLNGSREFLRVSAKLPPLFAAHLVVFPRLRERSSVLTDARTAVKKQLLGEGLTCGEFYPDSPDSSVRNRSILVARAPWPLMAIRLSTPHDEIFLKHLPELHEVWQTVGPGSAMRRGSSEPKTTP